MKYLNLDVLDASGEYRFPCIVALGDGTQDTSNPALGWTGDPIPRWNGWVAAPLFDRATVDRIAAMLDEDRALPHGEDQPYIEWYGESVIIREPVYEAD